MAKKANEDPWAKPPSEGAGEEAETAAAQTVEEGTDFEVVDSDIDCRDTYETLAVPLTDADYKEYGIMIGQATREIAAAEDELAAVKSQYKSRIDAAVAKRNQYAAIINAGCEFKKVDCQLIRNFSEGTITLVRLDTGATVRTRIMGLEERQRPLKLEGEAPTL